MKVGILGTGFGSYHTKLYQKIEGVEVVRLFGRNAEKLKQKGEELHVTVTNDIYDIINDPSIDLVDICLPTKVHTQYIIEALKAGKHVFCETPLCYNPTDAELIQEAEQRYGKRVFVDLFVKFTPEYQYIHDAIQNNTYGGIKSLTIVRKTPPIWGPLGLDTIICDLMLHDLDLSVWFLGIPMNKQVTAISGKQGESLVKASLQYKDAIIDVEASSMMPTSYPFTVECEAIFENGMLMYHESFGPAGDKKTFVEYTSDGIKEIHLASPDPYESATRHVLDCYNNHKETILDVTSAANALAIAFELTDIVTKK